MSIPHINSNTLTMNNTVAQRIIFVCLLIVGIAPIYANPSDGVEETDPALFTVAEETIPKSEFIYVYEKHNSQDDNQYSKQSVEEYLDLYINFKLKVKEAEALGMDTLASTQSQLVQYRQQLAQSYLYDRDISEKLLQEAYDRMTKEVSASHILIMLGEDASPADTLRTYNKIMDIRGKITSGQNSFEQMAQAYSEDPSVKENNGNLGYITAFQTVYPFESAAYKTKVGVISKPVRTKFGYHIVKVNDLRKARGKVLTAHILVKTSDKDSKVQQQAASEKIDQIYEQLKNGAPFDELARRESADRASARKGGELPWFGTGKMLPEFEEVAFKLEKVGDYSAPFKTRIGWHIVQLMDKKAIEPFEKMKSEIKKKIERDSRAQVSKSTFIEKLKKEYRFEEYSAALSAFRSRIDSSLLKGKWKAAKAYGLDRPTIKFLIMEGGTPESIIYTQQDLALFVEKNQLKGRTKTIDGTFLRLYNLFVEEKLLEIEESRLELKHPEFARLMKEFRDGTLLFELTEKKVWNRAIEDTVGLQNYYDTHKDNYMWDKRVDASVITCASAAMAAQVRKMLRKKGVDKEKVLEKFNEEGKTPQVTIENGLYERGQNNLIDQAGWELGVSKNFIGDDGKVTFVQINEVLPPMSKKLSESRGYVVADYQAQLEKEWIKELRAKYPIVIKDEVLKTIYK